MELQTTVNRILLCGSPAAPARFSHEVRARKFYLLPLEVQRLSGQYDRLNCLVSSLQLPLCEASRLRIEGPLRSFNNRSGEGARLVLTVLAKSILPADAEDENEVALTGTICTAPKLRTTPLGRDICDLILAVNRPYGRSDYLPCIFWGMRAREISLCPVGTKLTLTGRLQSRRYIKVTQFGAVEKTAFEVSVGDFEILE